MPVRHTVMNSNARQEKIARALEFRQDMTPGEALLWAELRNNRLGGFHFRRQHIIDGFIVDFYCHAAALIVEVDGKIHATQMESDQERDQILTARGFRILRIPDVQVRQNIPGVLSLILSQLRYTEES